MESGIQKVSVPYDEYKQLTMELIRLRDYVAQWCPSYIQCKKCGAYHPIGYVCIHCE